MWSEQEVKAILGPFWSQIFADQNTLQQWIAGVTHQLNNIFGYGLFFIKNFLLYEKQAYYRDKVYVTISESNRQQLPSNYYYQSTPWELPVSSDTPIVWYDLTGYKWITSFSSITWDTSDGQKTAVLGVDAFIHKDTGWIGFVNDPMRNWPLPTITLKINNVYFVSPSIFNAFGISTLKAGEEERYYIDSLRGMSEWLFKWFLTLQLGGVITGNQPETIIDILTTQYFKIVVTDKNEYFIHPNTQLKWNVNDVLPPHTPLGWNIYQPYKGEFPSINEIHVESIYIPELEQTHGKAGAVNWQTNSIIVERNNRAWLRFPVWFTNTNKFNTFWDTIESFNEPDLAQVITGLENPQIQDLPSQVIPAQLVWDQLPSSYFLVTTPTLGTKQYSIPNELFPFHVGYTIYHQPQEYNQEPLVLTDNYEVVRYHIVPPVSEQLYMEDSWEIIPLVGVDESFVVTDTYGLLISVSNEDDILLIDKNPIKLIMQFDEIITLSDGYNTQEYNIDHTTIQNDLINLSDNYDLVYEKLQSQSDNTRLTDNSFVNLYSNITENQYFLDTYYLLLITTNLPTQTDGINFYDNYRIRQGEGSGDVNLSNVDILNVIDTYRLCITGICYTPVSGQLEIQLQQSDLLQFKDWYALCVTVKTCVTGQSYEPITPPPGPAPGNTYCCVLEPKSAKYIIPSAAVSPPHKASFQYSYDLDVYVETWYGYHTTIPTIHQTSNHTDNYFANKAFVYDRLPERVNPIFSIDLIIKFTDDVATFNVPKNYYPKYHEYGTLQVTIDRSLVYDSNNNHIVGSGIPFGRVVIKPIHAGAELYYLNKLPAQQTYFVGAESGYADGVIVGFIPSLAYFSDEEVNSRMPIPNNPDDLLLLPGIIHKRTTGSTEASSILINDNMFVLQPPRSCPQIESLNQNGYVVPNKRIINISAKTSDGVVLQLWSGALDFVNNSSDENYNNLNLQIDGRQSNNQCSIKPMYYYSSTEILGKKIALFNRTSSIFVPESANAKTIKYAIDAKYFGFDRSVLTDKPLSPFHYSVVKTNPQVYCDVDTFPSQFLGLITNDKISLIPMDITISNKRTISSNYFVIKTQKELLYDVYYGYNMNKAHIYHYLTAASKTAQHIEGSAVNHFRVPPDKLSSNVNYAFVVKNWYDPEFNQNFLYVYTPTTYTTYGYVGKNGNFKEIKTQNGWPETVLDVDVVKKLVLLCNTVSYYDYRIAKYDSNGNIISNLLSVSNQSYATGYTIGKLFTSNIGCLLLKGGKTQAGLKLTILTQDNVQEFTLQPALNSITYYPLAISLSFDDRFAAITYYLSQDSSSPSSRHETYVEWWDLNEGIRLCRLKYNGLIYLSTVNIYGLGERNLYSTYIHATRFLSRLLPETSPKNVDIYPEWLTQFYYPKYNLVLTASDDRDMSYNIRIPDLKGKTTSNQEVLCKINITRESSYVDPYTIAPYTESSTSSKNIPGYAYGWCNKITLKTDYIYSDLPSYVTVSNGQVVRDQSNPVYILKAIDCSDPNNTKIVFRIPGQLQLNTINTFITGNDTLGVNDPELPRYKDDYYGYFGDWLLWFRELFNAKFGRYPQYSDKITEVIITIGPPEVSAT